MMTMKKIVVAGGGTLGSKIAYQTAFSGFDVTLYDINAGAISAAKRRMTTWDQAYAHEVHATPEQIQATNARLTYEIDLGVAVTDADLVIEAIPEVVDIKNEFYSHLAQVAPAKTIFATNTSTLLPSQFAAITQRPEKFLALHFANHIWANNTAEIMGHPTTDPVVYETVVDFAHAIGMITIELHKEQSGYVLNSLLIPWVDAALILWVKGIADVETIDKTWMLTGGSPIGPFGILDEVGLRTAYNIMLAASQQPGKEDLVTVVQKLKVDMLDQNKLGQESGQGFYHYPDPAFRQPEFLTNNVTSV